MRKKRNATLGDVLAEAYEAMGGVEALTQWARDNPEKFYALWAKLQPAQDEPPLKVIHKIERTVVRPECPDR